MEGKQSYFQAVIWPGIIFVMMCIQRAGHNWMIGWSKEDGVYPFNPSTILVVAQLGCVLTALGMSGYFHGADSMVRCFSPSGMKYFTVVGLWYAAGDVLEMEANKYMSSSTYTVLSQSKLIITAVIMIALMNKKQSQLQWTILVVTTLAMAEYVALDGNSIKDGPLGIALALGKVFVSCYVAVLNERAMKQQDEVFLVQFVQVKAAQLLWALGYTLFRDILDTTVGEGSVLFADGGFHFFDGYNGKAWALIFAGFVFKALLTQYIIKILDSLLKNITEVISVLLVYFANIAFAIGGATFDMPQFIAVLTVMLAVYAYILTKQSAPKDTKKVENKEVYEKLMTDDNKV